MHFGKQLKLLAYEPWKENHLDYAMLKRVLEEMMQKARAASRIVMVSKSALEKQRKSQETDYDVLRESFRSEIFTSQEETQSDSREVLYRSDRHLQAGFVKRFVPNGLLERDDAEYDEGDEKPSEKPAAQTSTATTTTTTTTATTTTTTTVSAEANKSDKSESKEADENKADDTAAKPAKVSQLKLDRRLDGEPRATLDMQNLRVMVKEGGAPVIFDSADPEDSGMSFYGDITAFSTDAPDEPSYGVNSAYSINPGDEMTALHNRKRRRKENHQS